MSTYEPGFKSWSGHMPVADSIPSRESAPCRHLWPELMAAAARCPEMVRAPLSRWHGPGVDQGPGGVVTVRL